MKGFCTRFHFSISCLAALLLAFSAGTASAQVKLSNGSNSSTIDFSSSMPVSVGTNPSTAFTGSGFSPDPTTAGRLNSNAWATTGWSDGALAFGGTNTTGDHARGSVSTAQTTGGFYAFTGTLPQSVTNPCLMIQPGGSDWAPGTLTLRIENTGTTNITQLVVSYNIFVRNDQGRANSFNFSHSADNVTYTPVAALDYTSTQIADALGWVLVGSPPSRSTTITGLSIAPGSFYYIRWSGADVSGSGSRDEFGLDDIAITATFACSLNSAGLANVHCEDNNETPGNSSDDYIWFQLNPTGANLGTGYNVTVSSGSVLLNGNTPANDVPYGITSSFRLQAGSAGGGNVTVTVTDVSGNCMISALITDPGSCSAGVCSISSSGLSDVACNNNGTVPNATDDYITFFLNPSGTNTGPSYSLSVSSGTVTKIGGAPATNVPYGSSTQFRLQNGSAGAGNVTVFITDDNDADCVLSVPITDPGPCSAPACSLSVSCPPQPAGVFDCNNPLPAAVTTEAAFEALGGNIADNYCGQIVITSITASINNCSSTSVARTYTIFDDLAPFNGIKDPNEQSVTCTLNYTYQPDQTPPTLNGPFPQNVTINCNDPLPVPATLTATDNCSGMPTVNYAQTMEAAGCDQEKFIYRTWTPVDACGNPGAPYTQTISVVDNTAPVFNLPLPQDVTVACGAPVPTPAIVTATDNCDPGNAPPVIWINEFHYDNVGTDVGEFVEVAGSAGLDLTQYAIYLYNGTGGVVYDNDVLSGTIDDEGNGTGAVALSYPANGIQNGPPDGIALVRLPNTVIQFISYEGVMTATDGPAAGMTSQNIPVSELGSEAAGLSLQLTGTGNSYANFTWTGPIAASPGTINANQTVQPQMGVITATMVETTMMGTCTGSLTIKRTYTASDDCGNPSVYTQTISVVDNVAPVFAPPLPANITISCSDPVPPAATLVALDACSQAMPQVWINEIHYDNTGTDQGEFIEIAGQAGTDLSQYTIYLYNGSTGAMGGVYSTLVLSGLIDNESNGHGAVAFTYPQDGIQNGISDGIALVKGGMVIQFLSYEGVMTAVGGPANGQVSTDIGVAESGTDPVGFSLRLTGNGNQYSAFTWNIPAAATPGSINQGQTFTPIQNGIPVMFTETMTPGSCPQNKTITRTWKASDACGNMVQHTQTISVVDNTGPNITCASITVSLDAFGNASVTQAQLVQSLNDNCAATNTLTVTPAGPFVFTCAQQGTTVPVVLTAKDPCNNSSSCTAQVTVNPFDRCVPKILIVDPCICKNNATTLTNGQFGEKIKVESLAGQTWTVIAVNGLYSIASLAPPSAPTPIAIGTQLYQNPANSGDYYLEGIHVDAIGYSVTVRNNLGQTLTIGNSCQYPNPSITADLSGDFCIFSDPVDLTGNPGDANIVSATFTVNGVPTSTFDPAQGPGQYEIVYTVDGGVPKAAGPNDPGCVQSVKTYVNVVATPSSLVCNDLVFVSVNEDCEAEINPDMILEGTYGCYDDYIVELDKTIPYGNGPWVPGFVNASDLGKTYQVRVTHLVSGNKCWGNIKVEDKLPPVLTCKDIDLNCAITQYDPAYLNDVLVLTDAAYPSVYENCGPYTLTYSDTWYDTDCSDPNDLSAYVKRVWVATDASNNTASCTQYIYFERLHVYDVQFPSDVTVSCTNGVTDPAVTGAPYVTFGNLDVKLYPNTTWCELGVVYVDQIIPVCDGSYKILRKWTVMDWCLPTSPFPPTTNPQYYFQVIKVLDETGPSFTCPSNLTVGTDPFNCCATVNLPDIIITDNCSRIDHITAKVVTHDFETGAVLNTYTYSGSLTDFPGNNYWTSDTLGVFGYTPACLPIGTHSVTYTVTDNCGNHTTCTFNLTVRDLTPPSANCQEFTTVAINVDDPFDCYTPANGCEGAGVTWVPASSFDSGSNDNCGPFKLTIQRMSPYSDCIEALNEDPDCGGDEYQIATAENDSIKFYCCEVGTTQTVILTIYQTDANGNVVFLPDGSPISNQCMVQVEVQDKIKPACLPPANTTVSCENFDPSLWAYGKAAVADNCCLDTTKVYQGQCGLQHSANYSLFDTVCNRGTITRTFRAFDCHGFSSQCTQRVFVNYEQDYFVRFPNDVIVTVCDGTGNYGEPTFFGEDCELLGVSFEDEVFTVVPDACFKIERTWTIINWCTYNTNLPCVYVPNPNPNPVTNSTQNLPGPIVSAPGTPAPWAPSNIKVNPSDATATNYSVFYTGGTYNGTTIPGIANNNCFVYKQIIKVIDTQAPTANCPASPVEFCDLTVNNPQLWNEMYWWDGVIGQHDLCEGPSDLNVTATDACSGANINIEYLLFLDLDGDGVMETVVSSTNLPGINNVQYGNASNPNFSGGTPRAFDERPVPTNQKYRFAIDRVKSGNNVTAYVRWDTQAAQANSTNTSVDGVVPELPYGTHKIKWIISDGCGNQSVCEYTFVVKDCKAPTVVCFNGLSVNIMPTGMVTLWATDFLQYAEDNCTPPTPYTPGNQLKYAIRKSGQGTGFPVDAFGQPITNVTFTCDEVGTQPVELWAQDAAGNAAYCETYVIIQDPFNNCGGNPISVSGALKTEPLAGNQGVEDAQVELAGTPPNGLPSINALGISDNAGLYMFANYLPLSTDYTVTPVKDDNPMNGVSTFDLVLMSKHILGIEPLNSPYKIIAADVNKSNSVTTFDIVELRKLILGIYTELPNNTSWRFIDKGFQFANPSNPFASVPFSENISLGNAQASQSDDDFTGIKIGDLNGSVIANANQQAEDRTAGTLLLDVEDRDVKAGEVFDVTFRTAEQVQGFQFTMNLNGLTVADIVKGDKVSADNFGVFADALTTSIDGAGEFTVKFRADKAGKLSEMLQLSSRITRAEAYNANGQNLEVALRFSGNTIAGVGFELYQNQPNPWVGRTMVGFHLPVAATATLTVYDETGRVLFTQKGDFTKGYNAISLDRAMLNTTGVLYYKLETATDSATRKMIQTK